MRRKNAVRIFTGCRVAVATGFKLVFRIRRLLQPGRILPAPVDRCFGSVLALAALVSMSAVIGISNSSQAETEPPARSDGDSTDLPPVVSRQEKPFTTFSVELTSPELHDRTITFKEDGSYAFSMTELEKVPGKDYYRDSKDKYVARHGLASRDLRQLNKLIQETKWLAAPGKQDERLRDAVRYAMAVVHDGQNGQAVCYGNQERHYTDLVAFLQKVDRQEWWLYNLKKGERIFLYSLSSHLDEVVKKGVEPRVLDFGRLAESVRALSATGSQEQKTFARKVFEKLDRISGREMRAKLVGVWQDQGNPMRLVIKEDGSFEWTHAGPTNKWRATGDWDVSGQRFRKKFVHSPQKPEWVGQESELIIHQLTADTLVFHTGDDPNLSIGVTRYKRIKKEEQK